MVQENTSNRMAVIKMTMLSLCVMSFAAGCGIRGPLKTPAPVFGGDSKVDQTRVPTGESNREDGEDDDLLDLDVDAQNSESNI